MYLTFLYIFPIIIANTYSTTHRATAPLINLYILFTSFLSVVIVPHFWLFVKHFFQIPTEIFKHSLIFCIVAGSTSPHFSPSRCLSIVRICSHSTIEFRGKPQEVGNHNWVGNFAFVVLVVIIATMVQGENLLPTSFWIIKQGRIPPCSLPLTGDKSA